MAAKKARKKRADAGGSRPGYDASKRLKKAAKKKKVTKKVVAAKQRDKPISNTEMHKQNEAGKYGVVSCKLQRRHYDWFTEYAKRLGRTPESALEYIIRCAWQEDNHRRMEGGSSTVPASEFKP